MGMGGRCYTRQSHRASRRGAYIVAVVVEKLEGSGAQVGHGSGREGLAVPSGGDAQHLAVADDGGAAHACFLGQLCMLRQEGILPMHRKEVLWLHDLQNLFQLVPAAILGCCQAQGVGNIEAQAAAVRKPSVNSHMT